MILNGAEDSLRTVPRSGGKDVVDEVIGYPRLSLRERDRRWARVRALMDELDLDAVLAFSTTRDRADAYLAREAVASGIVLLPREGAPVLLSPVAAVVLLRHDSQGLAGAEERWIDDLRVGPPPLLISRRLEELGLSRARIGVADRSSALSATTGVPHGLWRLITAAVEGATWIDISLEFERLCLVKSPEEQVLARHAAEIGEHACAAFLAAARIGARESEVMAAVESEITRRGGHTMAPGMILRSGAPVHGGFVEWGWAGDEPPVLRPGDAIGAELFSCFAGFETQQQMHVRFGADAEHDRLADAAGAAYEIGIGMLRPGIRFSEISEAMHAPIAEAGAWSRAPLLQTCSPVTSNGAMWVGAAGREDLQGIPVPAEIAVDHDFTIEAGMTFALEPNAVAGLDQVCVGGTVLVTAEGCEELNEIPTRAHVAAC